MKTVRVLFAFGSTALCALVPGRLPAEALFAGGIGILIDRQGDILAVADIDGDGLTDAVVHHVASGAVTILFADRASRAFAPPVFVPVGLSPVFSSSGDLDGDGRADLVVQNYGDGTCSILLQRSPRGFEEASRILVGSGVKPRASRLADLDGDGDLDLVLCVLETNTAEIYHGDGRGGFERAGRLSVSGPPHTLALEDFDGDGVRDLAVPVFTSEGNVHWFRGDGRGSFSGVGTTSLPGRPLRYSTAADFDADGRMDLAVIYLDGGPIVLRNAGGWTFETNVVAGDPDPKAIVDTRTWHACLHAVDFEGDGDLDLFARVERSGEGGFRLYENDGTGTLRGARDFVLSARATAVALADFDRDGAVDALATLRDSQALYVRARSKGELDLKETISLPSSPRGLALLKGGSPRLVAFGTASFHAIEPVEGGRGFAAATQRYGSYAFTSMGVGNFDGIPGDEAALLDLLKPAVVILADPLGDPSKTLEVPLDHFFYKIAVADYDGDGIDDLALGGQSVAEIAILARPATAGAPAPRTVKVPEKLQALAAGDLDGDGRADLVAGTMSGLLVLSGDGRGGFARVEEIPLGVSVTRAVPVDLDRDGRRDVVVLSATTASVVRAVSDPTFRAVEAIVSGFAVTALAAGDLNGDGRTDLAFSARDRNALAAVAAAVGGGFSAPEFYGVGSLPSDVALEDLDGDGTADAATADYGSSAVSILRGLVPAGPLFRRGDVDFDGIVKLTDAIALLGSLFLGQEAIGCPDAADANDDGALNLTDGVALLLYLFRGGSEPPDPGPENCGRDPTPDALERCEGVCS
ncbi:MAG: FG-GAP repeat domain-containing protein [Planctomycetota bacterium]